MHKVKLLSAMFAAILILVALPACSAQSDHELSMAPMAGMPAAVQSAPVSVQQAYRFTVANPDLMKHIPCYCGCGDIGHTSNYSCYISGTDGSGQVIFDNHAMGCSICVDITQDAMRMTREGKSPGEIRTAVDITYSKYGKSNIP